MSCAARSSPMQASLSRPALIAHFAAASQFEPTFSFGGLSAGADTTSDPRGVTASTIVVAKAQVISSLEVAFGSRFPAVPYDHPILPNWSTHCLMVPRSGGAGHLRENRRAIVRSGDNRKHEDPCHQSATPKADFCARVRFRFASSYQVMELTIAAAKRARINTSICGQSLTDPGASNGEVASRCRSLDQKHAGNRTY
jgi:hypothetical protein